MGDVGRPTKFNDKTRNLIYKSLERGGTQAIIARRARINPSTMLAWLARGKELSEKIDNSELKIEDLSEIDIEFIEFYEKYYEDESEYLLDLIEKTGKQDNKWLLTRRLREEFGDETTVNLNAKVQTEISWKDLIENAANED